MGVPPNYERRRQMQAMRERGMSFNQIAREMGCTYQNVAQILAKERKGHFRPYDDKRVIYRGLRQ